MKVIWQDIYTLTDTTLGNAIKSIGKNAISESWGEKVHEDKLVIVLRQNTARDVDEADDFIIIPKAVVIKEEK